ncbi:MAG TPA: heme biosynthesis HemY N-terminal domain-containing protein [Alphaproteobacteria bacterium]|nr:heme biosynthesis HemY N-terminal domain-containing protein [Alphaproteobacteria bacterium]
MIRGLWFFAQLAVLVVIAVLLAEQPGSASIEWHGWLVETSAGMLVAFVVVLALVLIVLWRLWRGVTATPHAINRYRRNRRRARGNAALVRSLSAIASEEGAAALRHVRDANEIAEPALAHLAAAEAAELAGDTERAETEYGRLRERPETALIGLRGLIGLAERRGDLAKATEFAREARRLAPKSPWAARRLFELESLTGAFAEAERTLADATRIKAVPAAESDRLLARLILARASTAETAGNEAEALADATRAHELDPALADAAVTAARLLVRAGRTPAAERILTESWMAGADSAIARAWLALAPSGDPQAQLRQAERLHALDRDNPEGRLALAEAELAAGRWAEARQHLAQVGNQTTRRYFRLMAYLESASGNAAGARSWFEKSLAAPPDPGLAAPLSLEPARA